MRLFTAKAAHSIALVIIGFEWVCYRCAETKHKKQFHRYRLRVDIARYRKGAA